MDEIDTFPEEWADLIAMRGRHARRRETEAVREPGRLRKWFDGAWAASPLAYKQLARAWASRAYYLFHPDMDRQSADRATKKQRRRAERRAWREELRRYDG